MTKKYRKFTCAGIYLFVFLSVIGFLYLSINKISATGLEVQYPTISGQTITASTELPDYIKYLYNAGMFLGFFAVFISLTIAGVMYFLSPVSAELRASAKDRISGAISGLLILVLTYLIVTAINPQLSILSLNKLPPVPQSPATKKAPGVYFYNKSSDCPNNDAQLNTTSSVSDLGTVKNKVNSVDIVQDTDTQTSYISILYNNTNFWGKCQYISSNQSCQTGQNGQALTFAASASVYKYNSSPNGDGVYFYHKTCFNKTSSQFSDTSGLVNYCNTTNNAINGGSDTVGGGYLKISNSDIGNGSGNNLYVKDLNQLKFTGNSGSGDCTVPKEEQDCIKYDKNGKCTQRSCPTLAGENISSIIINGDYIVLFVYFGPGDTALGPWTSCQEFPTSSDVNEFGPEQMKWENIRNGGGVIPNYVIIIPIKR